MQQQGETTPQTVSLVVVETGDRTPQTVSFVVVEAMLLLLMLL